MMDERPKIEVVRVSSFERQHFRPLDAVQLRAAYSHMRVGTYCPDIDTYNETTAAANMPENKPPPGGGHSRKFKKNLGPVSRLLRRRHQGACLATKSCDNIYNVNRNSNSLDWRIEQSSNEPAFQSRQSSSLDWRVSRRVNPDWRNSSRSAEQLSQSAHFASGALHTTPSAKSKIVSLLRRLSPRLSRNGNNNKTTCPPLSSSPTMCPWIRVEYSNESMHETIERDESQETDVSYQRELQLNELRKKMLGYAAVTPTSPFRSYSFASQQRIDNERGDENANKDTSKMETNANHNLRVCRAVHEDRRTTGAEKAVGGEVTEAAETRGLREVGGARRPRRGPGHGEVAGLEESQDTRTSTTSANGTRLDEESARAVGPQNRRPRPLSLAVQPLNYQRLDPDRSSIEEDSSVKLVSENSDKRHPNMTSQESIGNCSLDVDRSASDRSEATLGSVSEKTLHSLNLSCNGKAESPQENLSNGSNETLQKQQQQQQQQLTEQTPVVLVDCLDGEKNNAECELQPQQLTAAKKPSYLGLACSISGYSGITRYDSKLREGFRSRDSSPGSRLITRETSPAGFRSSESLGVPGLNPPTKSQSISPLAMDRQNGFSNGTKECKIENFAETRSSTISSYQGFSEVDRGLQLHTNFADISPIRSTSPVKRTTGTVQIGSSYSRETKTYTSSISISSPRSTQIVSNSSLSETSFANGSSLDASENQTINNSSCSEKSFIQQRVERLYGPGALAQGFFFKRGSAHGNTSDTSFNKTQSSNNNDKSIDNANTEESLKNLPVLRHLRPEFRAQLPVVSPRKATDGSEQVIKPLQRISVTSQRKNDTNAKVASSMNSSCSSRENESIKLSASVTSIPDQQPAAPEVVLPVLETSPSSTSIAATEQAIEPVVNPVEEKHGHHFMRLLNAERDRLLSLAESAEADLAKADPATLPEEAEGKLRSAAGKARLLAKQKMQQFEGLCHKNISQVPGEKFPTTYEDLAGFWDMVMLQVVQVNEIFAQIEKLKSSQWQESAPENKLADVGSQNGNSTKRRVIVSQRPKTTAASEASKKARELREQARRKMMEDRRRAMRSGVQKESDEVTIFAPET
ncbi:disks large-associated protein 1 isoform X2 [Venturia canescens]|uniref:disks large-associated protein 1 isoform X2 n=1 Tax=Venturia canescens TaxID=32260 RepID=UPI001C9C5015|nr:disks large-associated protein 1 isoform X2 [Venturia canescens]